MGSFEPLFLQILFLLSLYMFVRCMVSRMCLSLCWFFFILPSPQNINFNEPIFRFADFFSLVISADKSPLVNLSQLLYFPTLFSYCLYILCLYWYSLFGETSFLYILSFSSLDMFFFSSLHIFKTADLRYGTRVS